eukprot:PRCOL_00004816-RA
MDKGSEKGGDGAEAYAYSYTLPPATRWAGLSHLGDLTRLATAYERLRAGERVRFVAYGTSITANGGCHHMTEDGQTHCVGEDFLPGHKDFSDDLAQMVEVKDGWFKMVARHVTRRFPHPGHEFINVGKHAGSLGTSVSCASDSLFPAGHVDVVFIEYACMTDMIAIRDREHIDMEKPLSQDQLALERVLRKFMAPARGRPAAVVMVNTFHWCRNEAHCVVPEGAAGAGQQVPLSYDSMANTFLRNGDDGFAPLLKYYGQAAVSTRDALYHHAASGEPGFGLADMIKEGDMGVHHNLQGGKYVADLVVHLLETAWEHAAAADLAIAEGLDGQVSAPALPPPLWPGNFIQRAISCWTFHHEEGKRVLSRADGWQWSDHERGAGGAEKAGMWADTPGAVLEGRLSTMALDTGVSDVSSVRTALKLEYVSSYEHFGVVRLECVSGCVCDTTRVSAHVVDRAEGSPIRDVELDVTPSAECVVRITLLEETDSGEHYFKVLAMQSEWRPGAVKDDGARRLLGEAAWLRELAT